MRKIILSCLLLAFIIAAKAQEHPIIYGTQSDKSRILALIDENTWGQDFVAKIENTVKNRVNKHITNPEEILNTIPGFAEYNSPSESRIPRDDVSVHANILITAKYASTLYYLTGEKKYAQYAADVIMHYLTYFSTRTAQTTSVSGDYFSDPRAAYSYIAVSYDLLYNFLKKTDTKIYSKTQSKHVAYNHYQAQKGIKNMIDAGLQEWVGVDTKYGKLVSNHPILSAPGVLFPILCLDDDAERNRLLDVFWESGTKTQNSFKKSVLPMFGEQGIWPESVSYGYMPIVYLVLNILDRVKPEYRSVEDNKNMFSGNIIFMNLRLPDRRFVSYGDSHRHKDETATIYRYVLDIAERKGYGNIKNDVTNALEQTYLAEGGYLSDNFNAIYDRYEELELFWGKTISLENTKPFDYKSTVVVKHAGVALQRNHVETDNEKYGLCGIIGGAHYVHSHLTGISMELYGAGYVMAANGSLPLDINERGEPLHENYYRIYAGTNTVVINGESTGRQEGSWNGSGNLWQNTTENIAAEPIHLEKGISTDYSFATQSLDDEVNNAKQQRTLAIVRTSPTTGYYVDMFRSKSNGENKFHDYIYHNVGDQTVIKDTNNKGLTLNATSRYNNNIGDLNKSPGWEYFSNEKVSDLTTDAVKVRFDILHETEKAAMHMFIPNGVERDYTVGLAPPTRGSKNNYTEKNSQVLIARKNGEAWDQPFVSVFEPTNGTALSSVKSTTGLMTGAKVVGTKVVSKVNNETITDYVISHSSANETYIQTSPAIEFKGRFAVVRVIGDNATLYIGDGESLTYNGITLNATNRKGLKQLSTPVLTIEKPADDNNIILHEGYKYYVKATATDADGDMANVQLLIDGNAVRTDYSSPYEWGNFDANKAEQMDELDGLSLGIHTIKLIASDKSGLKTEKSFTVTVQKAPVDYTAPEGYTYAVDENETININGSFDIAFGANGQFKYLYNQTSDIACKSSVFDGDPTPGIMKKCYIKAAPQAPQVSFSNPTGNLTVNEGYDLTAVVNATDADGSIANVKLYIDNELVRQETVAPYEWGHEGSPNTDELNNLTPGQYKLKAVATDNDGLTAETTISLTVEAIAFTIEAVDAEQIPNIATNMLDSDITDDSRWSAQEFPKSVVFDLGINREINGTNMWTYQGRAYQYKIEVSDYKATGFSTVIDKTNNTNNAQPFSDNFSANGRYVRLTVTGAYNYTNNWTSINEFEILTGTATSNLKSAALVNNLTYDSEQSLVTVYPNPTSSSFKIELSGFETAKIAAYDIMGKLIYSNTTSNNSIELSKDDGFVSGIYLIKIIGDDQTVHQQKLIVK